MISFPLPFHWGMTPGTSAQGLTFGLAGSRCFGSANGAKRGKTLDPVPKAGCGRFALSSAGNSVQTVEN